MRRLPEAIKRRIVEHLACYQTHTRVSELIAEEFAVTISPRHVRAYDPLSFQFAGCSRWIDYFNQVRNAYGLEVGKIAISHRTYRLQQLQALLDAAMERNDPRHAMLVLRQAAKEVGNLYVRM